MSNCSYCKTGNYDVWFHFRKCCYQCGEKLEKKYNYTD